MKFKIEQIAICPSNPVVAIKLLQEMGAEKWITDRVEAAGVVRHHASINVADLNFNYDLVAGKEFEVLSYISGNNWMQTEEPRVSHLGMHCTERELNEWKSFFSERNIKVAQEVYTSSHTNAAIKDTRRYHYCIFDTYPILGVDLKFIVRRDIS